MQVKDGRACRNHNFDGALDCLSRQIGDPEKAKEKVRRLRLTIDKIDDKSINSRTEIFKALGDHCRLRILELLRNGEFCVCEIMTALDRPQSTTSHHLSILREAGLVKERREGKWSYYRLADGAVIELINQARLIDEERDHSVEGSPGKLNV